MASASAAGSKRSVGGEGHGWTMQLTFGFGSTLAGQSIFAMFSQAASPAIPQWAEPPRKLPAEERHGASQRRKTEQAAARKVALAKPR